MNLPGQGVEAELQKLRRAVRVLTVSIWVLSALFLLSYAAPYISWYLHHPRDTDPRSTSATTASSEYPDLHGFDTQFGDRSPEDKIKHATVVVITRIKPEGGRHKAIISEILKRNPAVHFYYKVGDEYSELSHAASSNCGECDGQGEIALFTGDPAMMNEAVSFANDRIGMWGDMPLSEVRRLATITTTP
jgi:hypothetical protein